MTPFFLGYRMAFRLLLTVAALALGSASALAQFEYPIEIEAVEIGLPPGRFGNEKDFATQKPISIVKRGQWCPIYLQLKLNKELGGGAKLKIESYDSDGIRTTMFVPLTKSFNGLLPGARLKSSDFGYTAYVRPGDRDGDVRITILTDDGKDDTLAKPFGSRNLAYRDIANYVVVGLGSKLPGFDLPGGNANANNSTRSGLRGGRVEASAITNVMDMPDQYLGWQTADLVVLTTGSASQQFLLDLFGDNATADQRSRREALLDWVRRGGKLVVSVGSNASTLSQLKSFQAILPAPLKVDPPSKAVSALPIYAVLPGMSINDDLTPKTPGTTFPVAQVNLAAVAARTPRSLIPLPGEERNRVGEDSQPVVLQSLFGLGRITFVAFDLDQSPFLDYPNRAQFWDWLLREAGSTKSALVPSGQSNNFSSSSENEDEWAATIRRHVDTFDGVPVVSFGWVALFIILYTLVIGPIEYLVLKFVFKRLELTWITFPIIVATVSTAAYFTAYAIKGNDLKINKVDVVDVDAAGGKIYGRSWFTIFSPRIDNYTIGIEPADGWSVPGALGSSPATVGWMAGGSGGGGSIVSRGYTYSDDAGGKTATGLDRVPIQVWSTKAFSANWTGTIDPGTPLIAADLYHPPGNAKALVGSFVSNIPLETIENAVLLYAGKAFKLPPIQPGQRIDVPATGLTEDTGWFTSAASVNLTSNVDQYGNRFTRGYTPQPTIITNLNIFGALFHERTSTGGKPLNNAGLRDLDLSWRVEDAQKPRFHDEAILVFSQSPPSGLAEGMMSPNGASPTKLWLRGLPGGSKPREAVPGTMRQETFVRVFLPIRTNAKK